MFVPRPVISIVAQDTTNKYSDEQIRLFKQVAIQSSHCICLGSPCCPENYWKLPLQPEKQM